MASESTPQSLPGDAATSGATASSNLEPMGERRHLLVFSGAKSWLYQLPVEGKIVIGRAETADLQLDDSSISRQHVRLDVERERIVIVDLGSHNGTFVNRQAMRGERELAPGDVITINKTTLVFHATAPSAPPSIVLDGRLFRQRLEDELERAVRYARSFAVLAVLWSEPPTDRRSVARLVEAQLRRIDAVTWPSDQLVRILLAEAAGPEVAAFVARLRTRLGDPTVRIGHASCPGDGADLDALVTSADNAAATAAPGDTVSAGRTHQTLTIGSQRVIVADPAVVRLYALIERLAPIDLPVLITGETGCGKELAATAIHMRSPRRQRTLVTLNCAAISDSLVESEIFGHEKGAFTGAVSTKTGLLESAHQSTLFLDEIGELALPTQAKLLRVLETRRFTRVGDVKEREVDVRIVAATNRDLEAEVAAGRFRQDLYFRLTGALLHLPPLRERTRELPLLAAVFLDEACVRANREPMRITEPAMRALLAHSWPGNVRELKNLMQYLAAAHPEPDLREEHVRDRLERRTRGATITGEQPIITETPFRALAEEIRELEIARMRAALEATGGNLTRAAALLSVPIRTFSEKVKQYGLKKG